MVIQSNAEGDFSPYVVVGSLCGILIRNAVVGLKQESLRQKARRNAVPSVVLAAQICKVLVTEEMRALRDQETIERVPTNGVEIHGVCIKQKGLG
jgi:hypothetical protein